MYYLYSSTSFGEIKNIDIVNTVCAILDELRTLENGKSYMDQIKFVKDRPGHDFRYAINAEKIQNELNWFPCESQLTSEPVPNGINTSSVKESTTE